MGRSGLRHRCRRGGLPARDRRRPRDAQAGADAARASLAAAMATWLPWPESIEDTVSIAYETSRLAGRVRAGAARACWPRPIAGWAVFSAVGELACDGRSRAYDRCAYDEWDAAAAVGDLGPPAGQRRRRRPGAPPSWPGPCWRSRPACSLKQPTTAGLPLAWFEVARSGPRPAGTNGRAQTYLSPRRPGTSSSTRWRERDDAARAAPGQQRPPRSCADARPRRRLPARQPRWPAVSPRRRVSADRLGDLVADIATCRRCPRLVAWRERSGPHQGGAPSRTLSTGAVPVPGLRRSRRPVCCWSGLAPAAHGANRTGRVFTGDNAGGSGELLFEALHRAGYAPRPRSDRPRRRSPTRRLPTSLL